MSDSDRMANVEPVRLGPESQFKFKCHPGIECFTQCCRDINIILTPYDIPGIECFTQCCRDINIILTPYDIIRLKKKLDLSSEEFLAIYTEPQLLEKTDLPVITLKFLEEEDKDSDSKLCPFIRESGCLLFTMIGRRPAAIIRWVLGR
jgi:hypothetical protein